MSRMSNHAAKHTESARVPADKQGNGDSDTVLPDQRILEPMLIIAARCVVYARARRDEAVRVDAVPAGGGGGRENSSRPHSRVPWRGEHRAGIASQGARDTVR